MEIKKTIQFAYSYMKYKKGHTFFTLFILTFSVLGFILTNQITALYKNANIEIAGMNNGYHDFALNTPSQESLEIIEQNNKIEHVGNEWVIGYGESQFGPSVLIFRDEAYHKIDPSLSLLKEGKYPTKENEIALSNAFADEYKLKIGDAFDVNYSKYDTVTRKELYGNKKTFKITGIIDAPAYAFEAGLVSPELKDSYQISTENSLVLLKNPKNLTSQIDELILEGKLDPASISINQAILSARGDNENVQLFNYLINILMFITFGLVIYNLLYFDALSKTKDFGVLRCIGQQSSQLVWVMIIQTVIYVFISYVLALFIAYFLNSFLANIIIHLLTTQSGLTLNDFSSHIQISTYIQSFLLIIATVIPSLAKPMAAIKRISPKIAMSYNKDMGSIGSTKKPINQNFVNAKNKLYAYSAKCFQRHPRKILITACIVFLSGFLISCIIAFNGTGQINTEWIRRWIPGDMKIEDTHMQNISDSNASDYETFNKDIMKEILSINNVAKAQAIQVNSNFIKVNKNQINVESDLYQMHESELTQENDSSGDVLQLCNVYGVNDIMKYGETQSNDTDGVWIDSKLADFLNMQVGDKIQMISEHNNQLMEFEICYIFQDEFPFNHTTEGFSSILMSSKTMKMFTGRDSIDRIDLWLSEGADENAVKQALLEIKEIADKGTITLFNDFASDFYKEQRTQQSILMIVAVAFLIIMLITCFNAIANNFSGRSRETAIMYVVGMDKGSIMKTYIREGFYCMIGGFTFIIIAQVFIILFGQSFFEINIYIFLIYMILDLCILFFCMLSAYGCARKLTKNITLSDLQYE